MKNLILFLFLAMGGSTFAQGMGDVTIFSNTGDKFYVVLNGIRQNDSPETNVKVAGLTNEWYECKIVSANNNFTIDKKIIVKFDTLITYRVTEKKGKYKLKYFTETSLGTATAVPDQAVVTYHSTETPVNTDNRETTNVNTNTNGTSTGTVSTTTSTTSTTTTNTGRENVGTSTNMKTGNGSESVNVNIDIQENGMGANVNMNVSGTETANPTKVNSTSSTGVNSTTTTTSTSTTTNGGVSSFEETSTTTTNSSTENGVTYYEETTTTTTTNGGGTAGVTNGSTVNEGNIYEDEDVTFTMENNCFTSDDEVTELSKQIANENFSDDQARIGNMAAENKCMSTDQIIKVAKAFSFEDTRLDFLKKAYANCTDQGNYYKVMETLTFSNDKEELQEYINNK